MDPTGWAFERELLDGAARLLTEGLGREPALYEVLRQLAEGEQFFTPEVHAQLFEAIESGQVFPCVLVVLTPERTVLLPALPFADSPEQAVERDLLDLRRDQRDLRAMLFNHQAARLRWAPRDTSYHGLEL